MSDDYVYPQNVLPKIKYQKPEVKPERCGTCTHGYITNAGAVYPGFHCHLIERLYKKKGIKNGSTCVDRTLGICKRYKYWKEAEEEAEAKKTQGASI